MLWITGALEPALVHEQRGIDRIEIGENRLPEQVSGAFRLWKS